MPTKLSKHWRPEFYCQKSKEIVEACTAGRHTWVGTDREGPVLDPEDACLHCVLDLDKYIQLLHKIIESK